MRLAITSRRRRRARLWREIVRAGYYGSGSSSLDGLLALPFGAAVTGAVVAESLLDAVIDMVNPF